MRSLFLMILILFSLFSNLMAEYPELEYLRSLHSEEDVLKYVKRAYTDMYLDPVPESEFNSVRSKAVGQSFVDPNFGREWTFIYNGGSNIMNSERMAWNADTSLFFLEGMSTSTTKQLVLFDGKTAAQVKKVTIRELPSWKGGDTRTAFRWKPSNPDLFVYFIKNEVWTYNVQTETSESYDMFDSGSYSMVQYDVAGGDGNDIAPNGDILMGNKGANNFVYNVIEKKVVRIENGERVYLEPLEPFPTFNLGSNIDYACAFAGYIVSLDDSRGGTFLLDYNGDTMQELYRRTPHMDPTYFRHEGILYPGLKIRYNSADASHYSGKGLSSEMNMAYFHAWNPEDPTEFLRFPMDLWPSTTLGSGGQYSCNRYDGSSGLHCQHGPGLYPDKLPDWEARFGECYEMALYDGDSELSRRFAHHFIGYDEKVSSSDQPEGHISPDGQFAVIKTKWGWYKVKLVNPRLSKSVVDSLLTGGTPVINDRDHGQILPDNLKLHQNYPNPFNPETEITYEIPESSEVSLVVYDVLAGEKNVLVNGYQVAGSHSVRFDGSHFPTGIYFYQLKAGDFKTTRKMQLIR